MEEIHFTDYDRMTDLLMYFSENITLNFVVSLSRASKSGGRMFFQYESKYESKYGDELRSIKRSLNFYFLIDNRECFTSGIVLRAQDIEILLMLIEQKILPWYFGAPEESAYTLLDNKLILKEFTPVIYTQSDIKYLIFSPIVYEMEDGTYQHGIKMDIGKEDSVTMNIDKFMGFYHILKTTDMVCLANAMINYIKSEPYGINVYQPVGLGARRTNDNWAVNNSEYNGKGANSFLNSVKGKGE